MNQKEEICIIVGGSHAAGQLALSLRQYGWEGRILIIGEEPVIPYHHPPLSKAYLKGEKNSEQILIRQESGYQKQGIEFRLNTRVIGINRDRKTLSLGDQSEILYDKLALTTGGRVKKLNVPGVNLKNVFYLRNKADADALKETIAEGKKAIVIGGGYIGLETAAALVSYGMKVTVLEAMDAPLQRVIAPEVSEFFQRIHKEEGVNILTGKVVTRFEGEENIEKVVCLDETEYEADVVIIGIGIIPNVELASDAGLRVDDGIVVDEFGLTEDKDIAAAGDCTNHPSHRYGGRIRLESVPNATDQAKSAAAALCGKKIPYTALPWFWSEQFDVKLQIAGVNTDYDQIIIRGDRQNSRSFVVWYLRRGEVIAADCINRPKEFMVARQMIEKNLTLKPEVLADDSYDPRQMLTDIRQLAE